MQIFNKVRTRQLKNYDTYIIYQAKRETSFEKTKNNPDENMI